MFAVVKTVSLAAYVVPGRLTLCVWSPALDPQGNSLLGLKALELFAGETGLSIF